MCEILRKRWRIGRAAEYPVFEKAVTLFRREGRQHLGVDEEFTESGGNYALGVVHHFVYGFVVAPSTMNYCRSH